MIGEIIAIGDELISGRILNTTSSFAANQLFAAGHDVIAMATIGDDPEIIEAALKRALGRAHFVIVTGGLGSTSDDLTNETVSIVLRRPTTLYPDILKKIRRQTGNSEALNPSDNGNMTESLQHPMEKMAWLPTGAQVLKPGARMAGHLLVHDEKPIFFLPGVPHEMQELMVDCVIPHLASLKGGRGREVCRKVYKVFGVGETIVNKMLKELEGSDPDIRIGYYPVYPEVHVSLTVYGQDRAATEKLFQQLDAKIIEILAPNIYGIDGDTMESVVGRLLMEQGKTLGVGESCTGGLISQRITNVSGSSAYFVGGVVAYSNDLKESLLGVDGKTIRKHGAVSAQTAKAMAEGVRRSLRADIGVSVTGIAGPTGGTAEKPVGTVHFGLATRDISYDFLYNFSGNRWQIQEVSAQTALDLVRRKLLKEF